MCVFLGPTKNRRGGRVREVSNGRAADESWGLEHRSPVARVYEGNGSRASRWISDKASPRHAHALSAHDDVVEDPHTDQAQRVTELAGDGPIGGTGFCDSARMVVRKNGGARIDAQCRPHDLSRMDTGAVDGASEEFLAVEDAMAVIQPQDVKFFVQKRTQPHAQEGGGVGRVIEAALAFEPSFENAFGRGKHVLLCRFICELVAGIGE